MSIKPDPRPAAQPLDISMLTKAEMDEARARVRRKLADEAAMAELGMSDRTQPVRKGRPPGLAEEEFTITLDLYEGCNQIVIDSADPGMRVFVHGGTYTVPKSIYDTLRDIQARGWGHQREIDGKETNTYRKQQNSILKPDVAA